MTFRTVCILLALAACKDGGDGTVIGSGAPTGTSAGMPTGEPSTSYPTTTTPPVGDAACTVDGSNGLRVHCTASLDEPGWATVVMSGSGVPERSFLSRSAGTEVELEAWGLKADTEYAWTIGEASGTVTTGSIPSALQSLSVSQTGSPTGYDGVLLPVSCNGTYFVVLDDEGEVVWYEASSLYTMGMDPYEWSQADRSLFHGSMNQNKVAEVHVSGEALGDWSSPSGEIHHDVSRWGPYTYLIEDHSVSGVTVDGVDVYEGDTFLGNFALEDHFTVSGGGGGGGPGGGSEWSHANGIQVTEDGHMILSLRSLSAVLSVDADPDSPNFLEIDWVANGESGTGLSGADYANSGTTFSQQHNATYVDGNLYLFDNRGASTSRAQKLSLNDSSGGIDSVASWDMGEVCDPEGGAVPTPDGGVLASCSSSRKVMQFAEGSASPTYTIEARCGGGGGGPGGGESMNRAIPVWIE